MAFFRVRCDRCGREQILGSEKTVEKMAEAMRVFAFDDIDGQRIDEARAAGVLAYCAGFVVVSENVHKCAACRALRVEDASGAV